MKRKQIEQVPLKKPKRMKKDGSLQVAAQLSGKYLILDLWKNGIWASRHAMDTETGEYGSYGLGIHWAEENINNAFCDGYIYPDEDRFQIAEKDRALVLEALNVCHSSNYLEPFSSVYLDVLSGSDSVLVRLNGGYSA